MIDYFDAHLVASQIVSDIMDDLQGRKGFDHEFDQVDGYVIKEIADTWMELIKKRLAVEHPVQQAHEAFRQEGVTFDGPAG